MGRSLLAGILATAMALPMTTLAQPSGGATQVNLAANSASLSRGLLTQAFRLSAKSSTDDYLQAFIGEIAASGASPDAVLAAIDTAIGAPGLTRNAIQALESLRKRKRAGRDYTAGVDRNSSSFNGPGFSSGGGSDYIR